jgi:tetratricopeptide (TPR) repeat protein
MLLVVLAAYANHFHNEFHFDDFHSITGNVFLQDLRNIPRFFTDPATSSTLPDHAVYRPLVSTSLALDYRLGHDFQPFYFHLSTFFWFAVQLVLMVFLFRRIMDLAVVETSARPGPYGRPLRDPHPSNFWTALFATACYGLHPANAETVNYIVQRADLYCTLGVVAGLLWFVMDPGRRKWGWYLIPALAAYLSKAPALVFPLILLAYVWLFERDKGLKPLALPFLVTAAVAILTAMVTPPSFHGGAISDSLYRLTQPWVALHYAKSFFLPTELSADTDWTYVSGPFSGEALAGYLFVIALLWAGYWASRRRETRPIAFGICWFFLALLPTSLLPLAEVTNDHRMFFPFVGLALAVCSAGGLAAGVFTRSAAGVVNPVRLRATLAAVVVLLAAEAAGTHTRNQVWRTEESLWRDVTIKSPKNAVGLMNYAIALMGRNDFTTALSYLKRSQALMPGYYASELNMGLAYGGLGRDAEAVEQFERAVAIAPSLAEPHVYYARWLQSKGRLADAQTQLEAAVQANPAYFGARKLLIELYTTEEYWQARDRLIEESLRLSNNEDLARRYMAERATPESLLNLSAKYCNSGNYVECLATAKEATELKPSYAEAYNNMAAAYIAMQKWDKGIEAAREALRIKPDYEAARSNLDWALSHR